MGNRLGACVRLGRTRLQSNQDGATAVEFAIVALLLIVFTFILIEFSLALFQWHAAEKATHFGARKAIVSDPVASNFTTYTGKTSENKMGQRPMPFPSTSAIVCSGQSQTCVDSDGNSFGYSATALARIVTAMNKAFGNTSRITSQNVIVQYEDAGLCFVGRPGGPCPAVTVKLQNLTFNWIVLGGLLGIGNLTMPAFSTTLTAEDMNNRVV